MIKVGDVVVSNGTIADVESYLGNKPHEVLEVGKMAGVSFDMVWLDGKAIPCPADGLRVVSGPMTSMPDHNRAAFDAAHELELSKNASKKGADFGQLGDCAKMREALKLCVDEMCNRCRELAAARGNSLPCLQGCEPVRKAKAALAAPPRNCDLPEVAKGQPKLAEQAWRVFKRSHKDSHLDAYGLLRCIRWLLAPATEGGAK